MRARQEAPRPKRDWWIAAARKCGFQELTARASGAEAELSFGAATPGTTVRHKNGGVGSPGHAGGAGADGLAADYL